MIDPRQLRTDAYRDPSKLADRQAIYRYRAPGPDFHGQLIELVDWSGVRRLADVGCGNSIYIDRIRPHLGPDTTVLGLDLSAGMLRDASHPTGRLAADVQAVPLRSGCLDVALALHMLYHVPDVEQAVRELRRVVREGGALVVATNGSTHLQELGDLMGQPLRGTLAFGLDAAEETLGRTFATVERHDLPTVLEVPEAEPVVAYLRSTISLGNDPATVEAGEAEVERVIADEGVFRISVHPGVLVCR